MRLGERQEGEREIHGLVSGSDRQNAGAVLSGYQLVSDASHSGKKGHRQDDMSRLVSSLLRAVPAILDSSHLMKRGTLESLTPVPRQASRGGGIFLPFILMLCTTLLFLSAGRRGFFDRYE